MRKIALLGSTGSIGINTLDVVRLHPDLFSVYALSAHRSVETLYHQCLEFSPRYAAMGDEASAEKLRAKLTKVGSETSVLGGEDSISSLARDEAVDVVVAGIVGAIGLMSTLAAVRSGKMVLIANKEPLVMLGAEIMRLARTHKASIVPVDSEHNAIFQCIPAGGQWEVEHFGVEKIILTGSGGPLRTLPKAKFSTVTPAQACAHPNWTMGRKISVDSATMMNKGLELIEACALFNVAPEFIQIAIHPQSVIHSMVQYVDGSILAQLGAPDMRTPIAHALGWPDRIESGTERLDLFDLARFDFEPADENKFPALRLARAAAEAGGTLPTILNAANEIAVEAFLKEQISFDKISDFIELAMATIGQQDEASIEVVLAADKQTREYTLGLI